VCIHCNICIGHMIKPYAVKFFPAPYAVRGKFHRRLFFSGLEKIAKKVVLKKRNVCKTSKLIQPTKQYY